MTRKQTIAHGLAFLALSVTVCVLLAHGARAHTFLRAESVTSDGDDKHQKHAKNLHEHVHVCAHDEKQAETLRQIQQFKSLNGESVQEEDEDRRILAAGTVYPSPTKNSGFIRITRNPDNINTVLNNQTLYDFTMKIFDSARAFFSKRLKVIQIATPTNKITASITNCGPAVVPTADSTTGIANSDMHFYLTGEFNSSASYLAYATYCDRDDATGRPKFGVVNFNFYYMTGDTSAQQFARWMSTVVHEMTHAFAFSRALFPLWHDTTTGLEYGQTKMETVTIRGLQTTLLKTNNIVAQARAHFGCDTLTGMQLENQGGDASLGSHWERTVFGDEIMTSSIAGYSSPLSAVTLAAFQDSGWYYIDLSYADVLAYGRGRGCDFVTLACTASTAASFSEFCNANACGSATAVSTCTIDGVAKGCCYMPTNAAQRDPFLDGTCNNRMAYSNAFCVDPTMQGQDQTPASLGETYSLLDGRCFQSSIGGSGDAKCYKYQCDATGASLTVTVGSTTVTCTFEGQQFQGIGSLSTGTLTCPDPVRTCATQRRFCKNMCNQRGFCMGGVCHCMTGFYGAACESTACDAVKPFVSNTDPTTCVTSCPDGFYGNPYNGNCDACHATCAKCTDGTPKGCAQCVQGRFLESDNSCVKTCPDGKYADSVQSKCLACDGVTCSKCVTSATTCTACIDTTKWVKDGACVLQTNCPANYKKDADTQTCAASCPQYKVADASGNCAYCVSTQPYYNSQSTSCVVSTGCPVGTYPDLPMKSCQPCHASCYTCTGAQANQCTACQSGGQLYLLRSACVSACDSGMYRNSTTMTCSACDSACTLCTGYAANMCQSCATDKYLDSGSGAGAGQGLCSTACQTATTFADPATRTCKTCDPMCKTCFGGLSTQCRSCNTGRFLTFHTNQNYTCETTCAEGSYPDSANLQCTACNAQCLTCVGALDSNCTSCASGAIPETDVTSGVTRCVRFCSQSYFKALSSSGVQICAKCDSSCAQCNGTSPLNCTDCSSGKFFMQRQCLSTCPTGYNADNATRMCLGASLLALSLTKIALLLGFVTMCIIVTV